MLRVVRKFNSIKSSVYLSKRFLSEGNKASRQQRIAEAAAKGAPAGIATGSISTRKLAIGAGLVASIAGAIYDLNRKESVLSQYYAGSSLQSLVNWIYESTWGSFQDFYQPTTDKLLPDWPTAPCYGNPIPGTPAPPVLVIDLERTLIGSEYSAKTGWRHVKRPGADVFLRALANYYEIVLFSENDKGMMYEVFEGLDKQGSCHKFGSAEGEVRDGKTLKRVDIMNRDPGRVLFIDDNPESVQLCARNAIIIKPYTDVHDLKDRALLDLIPLLQAFVHEDVQDFRTTLDSLGTRDAEEAVHEYELRLAKRKLAEDQRRNIGLGGLVRTKLGSSTSASFVPSSGNKQSNSSSISQDTANGATDGQKPAAPTPAPATKKKGLLFQMLDDSERVKEEAEMKKREKMNEIYTQRMREKMAKEAAQREKEQRANDLN